MSIQPRLGGVFYAVLVTVALCGCATQRLQVAEIAPGVYALTERSGVLVMKPADLKLRAEERALSICAEQKRALSIDESRAVDAEGAETAYATVRFRCS